MNFNCVSHAIVSTLVKTVEKLCCYRNKMCVLLLKMFVSKVSRPSCRNLKLLHAKVAVDMNVLGMLIHRDILDCINRSKSQLSLFL